MSSERQMTEASSDRADWSREALTLLLKASEVLSGSLDYATTVRRVTELVVPAIADWCAVDIVVADGRLDRLAVAHVDPSKVDWAHEIRRRYPPQAGSPTYQTLHDKQARLYPEIEDSRLVALAHDEAHLAIMRELGFTSAILVPMVARERALGVLSLVSAESGRRYGEPDLQLAVELARRAAVAIDTAHLFAEAQAELSERRQVEGALRASEERFRAMADAVPDIIFTATGENDCRYVNGRFYQVTGLPPGSALGKGWADALHPDDVDRNWRLWQRALASGEPFEIEYRLKSAGGGYRWHVGRSVPIRAADGRVREWFGSVTDIHDLKMVQQMLVVRARQQAAVADLGVAALTGATLSELMEQSVVQAAEILEVEYCKVLELLAGGEELLLVAGVGWQPGLVGRARVGSDLDSQAGYTLSIDTPVVVTELATEARFRGPQLLVDHGVVSGISVIIPGRQGPFGVLGIHTRERREFTADDIHFIQAIANTLGEAVERWRSDLGVQNARDALEERVAERTKELLAVNKELEAFTYSASHDLRAPLRGIDGFSQALLEDYGDGFDATARHYLERIRSGARRMGQLIDDLLKLSRVSRSEMEIERIDLSALAGEIVNELRRREPERQVTVVIEPGLEGDGDARLLEIVLENLLQNAWKFTCREADGCIEFGYDRRAGAFRVRDNGAGFDMDYADKLFVPFQRLHSPTDFSGTGVGLATAQRIIHRHGGRIWATGESGRGATFCFTLPTVTKEEPRDQG